MQSYRRLVTYLKKNLPEVSLSIRRTKRPSHEYGECNIMKDGSFRIRISNEIDEDTAKVILIHEVAHALSWHTDKHHSDHGPRFGIAYARVWRVYQDWLKS